MKKKNLSRAIALMAFLLLPAKAIVAQEAGAYVTNMVLTLTDGTVNRFALAEAPTVTHEGENLVVTVGEEQFTTPLQGISNLTFEQVASAISETVADNGERPVFTPGQARFEGLKAQATVAVYTIDGKMLSSVRANELGTASIDLGTLPQGLYILRTPTQSYKIKK